VAVPALLRRLRADAAPAAEICAAVLLTAFLAAALPLAFAATARAALFDALTDANPEERDLAFLQAAQLPAGIDDPLSVVAERREELAALLPASVRGVVGDAPTVIDGPRLILEPRPGQPSASTRYLTLRHVVGVADELELVSGRLPAARPGQVVEVALTAETARLLEVGVGDRLAGEAPPGDPLVNLTGATSEVEVEVTGIVAPRGDHDARYRPTYESDGSREWIYGYGLFLEEGYPEVNDALGGTPLGYTWSFPVSPERVSEADLAPFEADLARLGRELSGTGDISLEPSLRTGLLGILQQHRAQLDTAVAVLSVAALGALAVALTVVGLLAALLAERRAPGTALLRGRGASAAQLLVAQGGEGLVLALPAAAAGYGLAVLLVGSPGQALPAVLAAGVAAAAALLLVAATVPLLRRGVRPAGRPTVLARATPRRTAAEAFAIAVAVVGVVVLRRRGGTSGTDLYLAAVPVLLGLSTGIAALRLYPLPLRVLARLAAARRGLVAPLALARVARQPSATAAPLLVLALSLSVAASAEVLRATIEDGQVAAAWEAVGAEARIDPDPPRRTLPAYDFAGLEGVAGAAEAYAENGVELDGAAVDTAALVALDVAAYAAVVEGSPVASPPSALRDSGDPLPAVVSPDVAAVGDVLTVEVQTADARVVVVDRLGRVPGGPADRPFVMVALGALRTATDRALPATQVYLRVPEAQVPQVAAVLAERAPGATLTSRAATYAAVRAQPLVRATTTAFRALVLLAVAYSAMALTLSLSLTSRARTRDLAYLRTLGASGRQVFGLLVGELAPPLVLALALGPTLGVGVAALVLPGLDLPPFTGGPANPRLAVDPVAVGLLAGGVLAFAAVAVAVAGATARRADATRALRADEA
jgi:putative ABC transport system permease protein